MQNNNTAHSFYDKWNNNKDLVFKETLREDSEFFKWIVGRNGWGNASGLADFLKNKKRILDAGCGNGRVSALLRTYSNPNYSEVIGIDLVAAPVAAENLSNFENIKIMTKDLLSDLSDLGMFNFIYCQEVLHHTSNPKGAFLNLVKILEPDGEIAIYVYKRKAPIREFVDDYIREKISSLPYEDAMKVCHEITELGKKLSELNITVNVPDMHALEISAGSYDLQRFIYHFFCKCFWNPDISFEQNAVINYDWYHPQLCSRHTLEEIIGWFEEANLRVIHQVVDFYGITVRGVKNIEEN
ncbi:MAG: class I SAM-dependent methyltransferase [Smithella sp.]